MLKIIVIAAVAIVSAVAETTVPKGATQIEPGVHRHTDSAGKTHIYRKTPFGIVKSLEAPPKETEKAETSKATQTPTPFGPVKVTPRTDYLKVKESGDTVEFERASPFGSYKWKKNKNDLTPAEQEAWDRERQTSATGPKE